MIRGQFNVLALGAETPEATVIFPTFRSGYHLTAALDSILHQAQVTLEVMVSDDASDESTPQRLLTQLHGYVGPHRVLFRQGSTRLGIEHFALLVEAAASDIVIMAHHDDISLPHRARRLIDVFVATGADMVSSKYEYLDRNRTRPVPKLAGIPAGFVPAEQLIRNGWQPFMMGAALACRRSVYTSFPRLEMTYLNGGHDWLLPFRAALGGGFYYLDEVLLSYRRHIDQWTHQLVDKSSRGAVRESLAARGLGVCVAMRHDLAYLARQRAIDPKRCQDLDRLLIDTLTARATEMFRQRGLLHHQGKRLLWVDDTTFEARQHSRLALRVWRREPFRSLKEWLEANFLR